jgi:transcriptional antiterminator NusG
MLHNLTEHESGKKEWYAIHTYAGYEEAVARYLKQRIETLSMEDKIFDVVVPTEKKIRIKNGKRQEIEEKIYPGYVLVQMILTEETWYVVRNTPRVTGFVGPDNTTPTPLSAEEVAALLKKNDDEGQERFSIEFAIGDLVRVVDGPFKDYDGKIAEIDEEKGRVKVMVPVFGRDTAVEIDSLQIKKL